MTHSLEDAMTALRAGNIAQAGDICDGILAQSPDHPHATYVSGLVKYQRNEIRPAIETLVRAITLDPTSAEYHRSLGSIFKNTGATENAVQFYEQARLREPDDARTHVLLADALKELGDFDGALAHYHQGRRLNPADRETLVHIEKLEMVIELSRALLDAREAGGTAICNMGSSRFGHLARLCLPRTSVDFVQAYKSNLDARANAYNTVGLKGAFGDRGAILPHYVAEWIYDDYLSIRECLPGRVDDILDIGCGFGGLSALLQLHYAPAQTARFHLVEQAEIPGAEFSRPTPDAPPLDPLGCARDLLMANGVAENHINSVASDQADALFAFGYDLIVSIRSWCYLYPIETYIGVVHERLRPGGRLVVDVNKNLGGLVALQEHLPEARLISDRQDLERCLYVKSGD